MKDTSRSEYMVLLPALKKKMSEIPREMRGLFITMVCDKLGVLGGRLGEQITARLWLFFAELDAEAAT